MAFFNLFLISAVVAGPANTQFIDDTTYQPVTCVYEDYIEDSSSTNSNDEEISTFAVPGYTPVAPDTTSISDAYALYGEGYYYAEEFNASDSYDYVKYTAPYTRNIYFDVNTNNTSRATITVYLDDFSMTEPWITYYSDDEIDIYSTIYVGQGETLYFKVSCSSPCTWSGTLYLDLHPCGICYFNKDNLHGYSLPHDGPANIPYKFDDSALAYVPNQTYTWKDIFLEAMDIWEACGNITFVENLNTINSPILVRDDYNEHEVHINRTLLGDYYISEIEIPGATDYYIDCAFGWANRDGSEVTLRQAILGICVTAMGSYLGLGMLGFAPYRFNMMHTSLKPYGNLGEGDIGSLIYLWGDANE